MKTLAGFFLRGDARRVAIRHSGEPAGGACELSIECEPKPPDWGHRGMRCWLLGQRHELIALAGKFQQPHCCSYQEWPDGRHRRRERDHRDTVQERDGEPSVVITGSRVRG